MDSDLVNSTATYLESVHIARFLMHEVGPPHIWVVHPEYAVNISIVSAGGHDVSVFVDQAHSAGDIRVSHDANIVFQES